MIPRSVTKSISGWGNFPVQTCTLYRPEKVRDVATIVREAPGTSIIPRGLGRSYGDAALNADGAVMLLERLDRLAAFDPQTGVVRCEGGTSLADLLEIFVPRGWFLPVTPGTRFVTLAGAIAADVHGKNHHRDGCISEFVTDFDLVTASGETITCSREQNAEVFWATVGGMGLTGVILRAGLRLIKIETAYITVDYRKAQNLDHALSLFSEDANYQYSVAWIDCLATGSMLGRSVLMRGNHTPLTQLTGPYRNEPLKLRRGRAKNVPINMPSFVLNGTSIRAFNAMYYAKHDDARSVTSYEQFFYPLDSIRHWNRMYGKRGFVQYQAVFPPETSRDGLVKLLEQLSASGAASFLAVLKTFGPQNQGMLSFPRAGQTLALDLPNTGESLLQLVRELDKTVLDHGGRVYLAKDACLDRAAFEAMYPRLAEFKAVKARLDPQNRFASSQSRRLGITEGA